MVLNTFFAPLLCDICKRHCHCHLQTSGFDCFFILAVQDENGTSFLKLQASSPVMSKLICNCATKNSSLANSVKMSELKQKRNDELKKMAPAEGQPAKKLRTEQEVEIQVGSTSVSVLCPAKRAGQSDLLVKLQEEQLFAVFSFLKDDCEKDDPSKRDYKKTGKFAKGQSKKADPKHE